MSTSESSQQQEEEVTASKSKLTCPMCLKVYISPRCLACLHSFCELCIHSNILLAAEKATTTDVIECPICQTKTTPANWERPRAEWAKLLPETYVFLPFIETPDSKNHLLCDNCSSFGKSSSAVTYCRDCRQYQCRACADMHDVVAAMRGHVSLSLKDLHTLLNLGKLEVCRNHQDREVEYFCKGHNTMCCLSCAFSYHRNCQSVEELSKLGREIKEGDSLRRLTAGLEDIGSNVCNMRELLDRNVVQIAQQAEQIPSRMEEIKNDIIEVLNKLATKITRQCDQLKHQYSAEFRDEITRVQSLSAAIDSSRSLLDSALKHGNAKQIFIVLRNIEAHVLQYEERISAVKSSVKAVELRLNLSEVLKEAVHEDSTSPLDADVTAESVRPKTQVFPISGCGTRNLPTVAIQKRDNYQQPEYRGAEYLPDGRLVAVDFNNSLGCLLDTDFNVEAEIKLSSRPIDLTVVNRNELIVALPDTKQLQWVKVSGNSMELMRTVSCKRAPYSVSRLGDSELVVGWDVGISRLSLECEELQLINKDSIGRTIKFSYADYLVADAKESRLYRTRYSDDTVYCLDFSGEVIFVFNGVTQPCHLALDRDRNLYVCCRGTSTVQRISTSGDSLGVIDPALPFPYTICFNPAGDTMTLTNLNMYGGNTNAGTRVKFVPRQAEVV